MRTKRAIRKDQEAVSPVIATILMVAITVVLAAVLYVMVSGLVAGPGAGPQSIATRVTKPGSNWIVEFIDVPAAMENSTVDLIVYDSNGATQFTRTALSDLLTTTSGIRYSPSTPDSTIAPGDRILLDVNTYPAGYSFQLVNDDGVLASATLQ